MQPARGQLVGWDLCFILSLFSCVQVTSVLSTTYIGYLDTTYKYNREVQTWFYAIALGSSSRARLDASPTLYSWVSCLRTSLLQLIFLLIVIQCWIRESFFELLQFKFSVALKVEECGRLLLDAVVMRYREPENFDTPTSCRWHGKARAHATRLIKQRFDWD